MLGPKAVTDFFFPPKKSDYFVKPKIMRLPDADLPFYLLSCKRISQVQWFPNFMERVSKPPGGHQSPGPPTPLPVSDSVGLVRPGNLHFSQIPK